MAAAREKHISVRTAMEYRQPFYYENRRENFSRNPFLDIVRDTYKDTRSKLTFKFLYFAHLPNKNKILNLCKHNQAHISYVFTWITGLTQYFPRCLVKFLVKRCVVLVNNEIRLTTIFLSPSLLHEMCICFVRMRQVFSFVTTQNNIA